MKSSLILFELIKSLSKGERKFFRLYTAMQGSEKKYLLVFNAIDKQKVYDEKKIVAQFHKEKFVRQFPVIKHYLYNLILESLRVYNKSRYLETRISETIEIASVLFDKGLLRQAEKILAKAKALSVKHEKFELLLRVMQWEERIMRPEINIEKIQAGIHTFGTKKSILDKCLDTYEYEKLKYEFIALGLKQGLTLLRSPDDIRQIEKLKKQPLLKEGKHFTSERSRYHYYDVLTHYYIGKQDYDHALIAAKKQVELLESDPYNIKDELHEYLRALYGVLRILLRLRNYAELKTILEKTKNLTGHYGLKNNETLAVRIFEQVCLVELVLYTTKGDFKKGLAVFETNTANKFLEWEHKINRYYLSNIYYQLSYLYFGAGNFSASLKWQNKILNNTYIHETEIVYSFTRLINLLTHFELGNISLLESAAQSTYRYIYKKKRLYKYENITLGFVRKLYQAKTKEEMFSVFLKLKDALRELSNDEHERSALEYFDFIAWIDSKIEGRNFADVINKE